MSRPALLLPTLLLFGCAASRTSEVIVDAPPERTDASSTTPVAEPVLAPAAPSRAVEPAWAAPALAEEESLHGSRFTVKAGYYGAEEDALDDGYIVGVSWMNFTMSRISSVLCVFSSPMFQFKASA